MPSDPKPTAPTRFKVSSANQPNRQMVPPIWSHLPPDLQRRLAQQLAQLLKRMRQPIPKESHHAE